MKVPCTLPALSGLFMMSLVATAQATTLQFENFALAGSATDPGAYFSESGYVLASTLARIVSVTAYTDMIGSLYGPPWTSDFYSFCTCSSAGSTSLSRADGKLFSLEGFDAGAGLNFHLVGTRADDSQIHYDFSFTGIPWGTATLLPSMGFSNLKSVTFFASGGGVSAALDNIKVSQVPLPASAWLFGSALAGLAARGFRRGIRHD